MTQSGENGEQTPSNKGSGGADPGAIDPVAMAKRDLKAGLPKRFFKLAGAKSHETGFSIVLDGRMARTPGRNVLSVCDKVLAQALAEEWNGQTDYIDPSRMPLTRLANSALDRVSVASEAVLEDVVKYAGSDLLCYRASDPAGLVKAQSAAWDPVINWARQELDAPFVLAEGLMFVAQPDAAIKAFEKAVRDYLGDGPAAALRLSGLHVITSLTGSALLALAATRGQISADEAWAHAHVDEDYQARQWGEDAEAQRRRANRREEMAAAILFAHAQDSVS